MAPYIDGVRAHLVELRYTRDSIKVSAEFAKRFYFTTLRFGIIENTGGLGADIHLFQDFLTFKLDAFNFSVDELRFPRLRATLRLQAFGHLFATAGMDAVINTRKPDCFTPLFGPGWMRPSRC